MLARLHLALLRLYRLLPRSGRLFVVHRLAPSFTVGAICVVERADGALLLVRHSYRDRWGFPGGLLRRGEGVVDAAHREAAEEVDLAIELVGEPAVVVDPGARRVDVVYRARPALGGRQDPPLRPTSPEIVEVRWFPPTALPQLQHEAAGALVALARAWGGTTGAGRGPLASAPLHRPT
ncbi:MAG: NUDIX hydrolase [Acidimicrobiales bacterium]